MVMNQSRFLYTNSTTINVASAYLQSKMHGGPAAPVTACIANVNRARGSESVVGVSDIMTVLQDYDGVLVTAKDLLIVLASFGMTGCPYTAGCMDPNYANYNPAATVWPGANNPCSWFSDTYTHTSDSLSCQYGFTVDYDGSVRHTASSRYTTGTGTLAECYQKCSDGTWPNCMGFSRYHSASDGASAACWWVTETNNYLHDDGNSNEHLYINTQRAGQSVCAATAQVADHFTVDNDGSVRHTASSRYTTGTGTLAQCYQQCSDGTWANCKGFSRYMSAADTASAACWWVTSTANFVYDDGNSNEHLYIFNPDLGYCVSDCSACTNSTVNNSWSHTCDTTVIALPVMGCTDTYYVQYNPAATSDDGTCTTLNGTFGCTDSRYLNYDPTATWNDQNMCGAFSDTYTHTSDSLSCQYGFTVDYDGSVGGSYTTGTGTLAECYQKCSDGTWANCKGFSRYHSASDGASAACWWVTSAAQYIHDDGNSNEHLYINLEQSSRPVCAATAQVADHFTVDNDGSVTGSYTTGTGTLAQCYQQCSDGTWANCKGFSRYMSAADTASAACWWVTSTGNFVYDDGNSNEHLYIFNPDLGYCVSDCSTCQGATYRDSNTTYRCEAQPLCTLTQIQISEAHTSGAPQDYIELYNSGAECRLTGFKLDDSTSMSDFTFGDVVITAGGYWLGYTNQPNSFSSGLSGGGDDVYLCGLDFTGSNHATACKHEVLRGRMTQAYCSSANARGCAAGCYGGSTTYCPEASVAHCFDATTGNFCYCAPT
eukprot:COSAG01_NODE_4905_length_4639_cov_14.340088_1_plen_768_part_10